MADRWNRRTVMLSCDAARMVLYATLALLVASGQATLAMIIAIAVTVATLDVLFEPAALAAVIHLVPAEQLPAAFGSNEARDYAAALAGPPLGGALFGMARAVPFAFDALSYLVSCAALTAIRRPLQGDRVAHLRRPLSGEISDGISHVRRSGFLRALIPLFAFVNFAFVGAMFTIVVALRQAGYPTGVIGMAQGLIAVGGLLGALAASWLQRRASFRPLITTTIAILCGCLALSAALNGQLIMVLPVTVGLFLAPTLNAAIFSRLAATTPENLQGRVTSVLEVTSGAAASLAPLTMGILINHLGGTLAMTACAVTAGLSLATALTSRDLRT
jgi:MFS family permease